MKPELSKKEKIKKFNEFYKRLVQLLNLFPEVDIDFQCGCSEDRFTFDDLRFNLDGKLVDE